MPKKTDGPTLQELIDKYMETSSETRDSKTTFDKLAAFRYLTEIVGKEVPVSHLD